MGGGGGDAAALIEESPTLSAIAESGEITIGTKFDQPLFGQVDPTAGGEPVGFDVEIANLIVDRIAEAADTEVEATFVETPSAIRETAITDGTVDMVVATYTINDKRKELVAFAGPTTSPARTSWWPPTTRASAGSTTSPARRCARSRARPRWRTSGRWLPRPTVVEYDVYSKCADDLGNGRVDAVSTDNVILVGLVDQSNGAFKLVDNPFTEEPYGIGVPEGRPGHARLRERRPRGDLRERRVGRGLRVHRRHRGRDHAGAPRGRPVLTSAVGASRRRTSTQPDPAGTEPSRPARARTTEGLRWTPSSTTWTSSSTASARP
jgi:glutamate transport system substrate-binding protein